VSARAWLPGHLSSSKVDVASEQRNLDPVPADDRELAYELTAMTDEQLEFLNQTGTGPDAALPPQLQLERRAMFVRHADRLMELLLARGHWPTKARVGADAAQGAWLIAQHADTQLDVQRLALVLLRVAVAEGGAGASGARELAMLEDRVAVNEGRPQTYGTQIAEVTDGQPVPWPCAEPERLDELRAEAGLEPFAEHTARDT
jgi:hypothetical protein